MFLNSDQYTYERTDYLLTVMTGFSGLPYARHHRQYIQFPLGRTNNEILGHKILAFLESCPIVGAITAIAERIFFEIKNKFFKETFKTTWKPKASTVENNKRRMEKNLQKAISEHKNRARSEDRSIYVSPSDISSNKKPLKLTYYEKENQGKPHRPTMEDAHFFLEMNNYALAGVFDGHGGNKVSNYINEQFKTRFIQKLQAMEDDVYQALESFIYEVHEEIIKKTELLEEEWFKMGSTAVVCLIDKEKHLIYTATVGDSEANIYRKISNTYRSIPLSCVRDGFSSKEKERLKKTGDQQYKNTYTNASEKNDPKQIQIGSDVSSYRIEDGKYMRATINVSRSIGDFIFTGTQECPKVISKPKITVSKLNSGDKIAIRCDGITDFVSEKTTVEKITAALTKRQNPANELVEEAAKTSTDNMTAIVIDIA